MPETHTAGFERLSAVDVAFLAIETPTSHMHVGGAIVLDADAVAGPEGGVDFSRIREGLSRAIDDMPRMRQRLHRVPALKHWAWVDDPHFNLDYHIRHSALPRPGGMKELERMTARVFSQRLDRDRPLWEFWVVEGVCDGCFALIVKVHHCMLDGMGAVNLLAALAAPTMGGAAAPAIPEPPSTGELVLGEISHRLKGWRALTHAAREMFSPHDTPEEHADSSWLDRVKGIRETLKSGLQQADSTSINPDTMSPHRRYAMHRVELADARRIKKALGGTINDVVLATVTGALRRYLARNGDKVDAMHRFRALVPASVRRPAGSKGPQLGNQVSLLLVPLPIDNGDPRARLAAIRAHTHWLKHESHEADGVEWMEHLDDQLGLGLVTNTLRLAMNLRSFNVVVTNVPGPPFALELVGARVRSIHAMVPLFQHQGLGIALFSYDGGLHWGVGADWDAIPDIDMFVGDLNDEFEALLALCDD